MKKVLVVAMILLGILFLSACTDTVSRTDKETNTYFNEEYQVKNHSDGGISTFGLNIAPADEMGDWVIDWLADVSAGDGFQYFVYSDPDSWDVYLYYPNSHIIHLLTNDDVAVDFTDSALKVYVTESIEDTMSTEHTEHWILHFAATPRGVWSNRVDLYWNDVEIPCDAAKYDT